MDNIEQKKRMAAESKPKSELEIFKDVIQEIKEVEMAKKKAWEERDMKGEMYNPHFDLINPEYLREAEREVYEKYKNDTLSAEEFNALKIEANKNYEKLPDAEKAALNDFWGYIANLVTAREGRRQLEEMKLRKQKSG